MAYFPDDVIKAAQQTEQKYGVPASVTLAQWAQESGYGKSTLATNANNYFGVKGSYNGASYGSYRKYETTAQSFDDHGKIVSGYSATKNATNANEYVDAIVKSGYAEDPNYGTALKSIMASNNLTQYDGTGGAYLPGNTHDNTPLANGTLQQVSLQDTAQSVVGVVIRTISYIFLVVFAIVLFMNAFNMTVPTTKSLTKKAAKNTKAVAKVD